MMIARLSDGRFIIGVDAENIRRLTSGQPLKLDFVNFGGRDDGIMIYGETLGDCMLQVEKAMGRELPPAMPIPHRDGEKNG